jgi:hypothetical protein
MGSSILLGDSQASPARPSDKNGMKVKTLEWMEVVALDRGYGILVF